MTQRDCNQPERSPEELHAWRIECRDPGEAEALMTSMLERAKQSETEILIVDGDMVFGAHHLRSALHHARRAIDEGRNSSQSLTMETLLYASGERQLGAAIEKMSVGNHTKSVVVALLRGERFDVGEGWRRLESRPAEIDRDRLRTYGLSDAELSTVAPESSAELVLERVAFVDILKK